MNRFFTSLFYLILFFLFCAEVLALFGGAFWFFDLFSHWQMQYLGIGAILLIFFLLLRRWWGVLISICLVAWSAYVVLQAEWPEAAGETDIYFLNALYTNKETDEYLKQITDIKPPLIVIVETPPEFEKKVQEIGYDVLVGLDNKYDSLSVLVRKDAAGKVTKKELDNAFPYPIAHIVYDKTHIFVVHPFPGILGAMSENQESLFEKVSLIIGDLDKDGEKFMLIGDMNSSMFSPVFHQYFKGFHDPLLYSWYRGTVFQLPIDHVVSNFPVKVTVDERKTSDHSTLFIDS